MEYLVKHMNTPVLRFEVLENTSDPRVRTTWLSPQNSLLPLDMDAGDRGLSKWLKARTIPKNRAFVNSFLSKCGLSPNRPMDIISVSKGLSLNDVYWVVEDGFEGTFEKYNLYDNNFSRILALIAFTGYGSSLRTSLASSPEFTTNGMLPKCWRRRSGKVYLYKGGTTGFSNAGFEPYSEFYASQLAAAMGVNAIGYGLSKWQGNLCSTCELFTSKQFSFIPVGRLVKEGGMAAVRAYYENLGEEFVHALNEMIIFDAVICNTDRHFGNFGVLVDNQTNQIARPAPLFDHGNALFSLAGLDDFSSGERLEKYAATQLPKVYDDFFDEAEKALTDITREQLRRVLNFKLKKHARYNLPQKRFVLVNKMIQSRAAMLLE